MKYILILFLVGITSVNSSYAQTDDEFLAEEFIAEVFYGDMTEKSRKVYLNRYAYSGSDGIDYDKISFFCHSVIPDLSVAEMREVFNRYENRTQLWSENAPVFQQPKYKNLIFVEIYLSFLKENKKERN